MNSICALYYGNLNPQDRAVTPGSALQTEMNKLSKDEAQLCQTLAEEEKTLFLDYVTRCSAVLSLCEEDKFLIGFRLGARLAVDTFVRDDAMTKNLVEE